MDYIATLRYLFLSHIVHWTCIGYYLKWVSCTELPSFAEDKSAMKILFKWQHLVRLHLIRSHLSLSKFNQHVQQEIPKTIFTALSRSL